jgi:hypothetical protein
MRFHHRFDTNKQLNKSAGLKNWPSVLKTAGALITSVAALVVLLLSKKGVKGLAFSTKIHSSFENKD